MDSGRLWDSVAPGEATLVRGACLERGTQNLVPSRKFWALVHLPVPILLCVYSD